MMHLRTQILVLAVVPLVVAVLAITGLMTWQATNLARSSIEAFERNLLDAKNTELLNLTNLAISAISDVYEAASPDDPEAQQEVRRILSQLDYGEDGYFFVYHYDGTNVVHPRQSWREGENWLDMQDPNGDYVIANLIARAQEGGGLHQYLWEKPSEGTIADKLSFAVGLDKWQWMLGTGVYLDDVYAQTAAAQATLRENIFRTVLIVAAIAVPAVLFVFAGCMLLNLRERRLADSKLKALTQRVIDTQEEERARVARELHDAISQNLIGVRYAIDLARRKVRSNAADSVVAIEKGAAALNGAIKEVRRLSHDLRPGQLDDLGLSAALEALVNNFAERTGIAVELEAVAFKNLVLPEAKTALYRFAQEALSNIERHAGATLVRVTLSSPRGRVQMIVSDNGKGFEGSENRQVRTVGLGLRNMSERMAHFGGTLLVETASTGTTLRAVLPKTVFIHNAGMGEVA